MFLIAYKPGQLANQLFLFAHLAAFAAEHGLTVVNPSFDDYCEHFEVLDRDLLCRFPARKSLIAPTLTRRRRLYEAVNRWTLRFTRRMALVPKGAALLNTEYAAFCFMNEAPFQKMVSENRLVVIRGWCFRDLAAFRRHAHTLRRFFAPKAAAAANVAALIQSCRDGADLLVGVHIRRGDYREFKAGRYFFEPEQYAALMRQMERLFPGRRVRFLVCSNEAVSELAFPGLDVRPGPGHIIEDLYSLAECDYLFGPPSTYSQWASFYGEVPLYKIFDPALALSLDAFRVADGDCDFPEFFASCPRWGKEKSPLAVLNRVD